MNNINFDNPLLLIVMVVVLAIIIVSFIISVNKENRSNKNVLSFIIHLVITILISLTLAKTTYESVVTETNIYVLADVSYSSNKNLDLIDEYIENLEKNVPKNSKIGVICFGKDYELLVDLGEDLKSVKSSNVDNSQTNIEGALKYAASLFNQDVIKRIVLISDGEETNDADLVSLTESLYHDDIYVDAIYLDNNIKEDVNEVQINSVEYVKSTYVDCDENVFVYLQSNNEARAIVSLMCDGELLDEVAVTLQLGHNTVIFDLNTSVEGHHNYEVIVSSTTDESSFNNKYYFSQNVTLNKKVLFISQNKEDRTSAQQLYQDNTDITFYINKFDVPFTVEELAIYDEIVLSNVDIRKCDNYAQFVNSLDILVSEYGKSLITIGNTYVQNNEDDQTLNNLSNMLPTKYGNDDKNKAITILLDISRSMEQIDRFNIAKRTACTILDNLDDDVLVSCITFYADVKPLFTMKKASEREELKEQINKLKAYNGTYLAAALSYAYSSVSKQTSTKNEIILISDGLSYRDDKGIQNNDCKTWVKAMQKSNIVFSAVQTVSNEGTDLMKSLVEIGRGYYYKIDEIEQVKNLVLNEVLNSLNEIILENCECPVNVLLPKHDLIGESTNLPAILGLYNNTAKSSADVVIETIYTDIDNVSYNIPLYTTWEYGNGQVSSFASMISGEWISLWKNNLDANKVLENIITVNKPEERIDSAFIISSNTIGSSTDIIVKAPTLNKDSVLSVSITCPDNTVIEKDLVSVVDGNILKYMTTIDTSLIGEYNVNLTYSLGDLSYNANYSFEISYLPEYNSFTIYEASNLYYMVSSNGQVSEDGNLVLVNDNSNEQKYIIDFTPIFMLISIILFVVDIIIRKLRWQDIASLFKKIKKENKN